MTEELESPIIHQYWTPDDEAPGSDCLTCNGTGEFDDGVLCRACDGTGIVPFPPDGQGTMADNCIHP